MATQCNFHYELPVVSWREKDEKKINSCEDGNHHVSAAAFVRFKHNRINASIGAEGTARTCLYINSHINAGFLKASDMRAADGSEFFEEHSITMNILNAIQNLYKKFRYGTSKEPAEIIEWMDGDEIYKMHSIETKVWNAVQNLIPNFGDYKKIEISTGFIDYVFSPIIPDSPLSSWVKNKQIPLPLRVCAFWLLFIESPIRHFAVFTICRAMDLYSLRNPDFAEYYRFRAKINSNHPISAAIEIIL